MNGKQFQQLAYMEFFTGMPEHNHLRLWRKTLQGSQSDIQIGDVCASVIVAVAINEFPYKKIGRLFLQRPVKIAGTVETLRRNAQFLIQGTEIGVEGGFDQGKKCFHATAVYMVAY